jgi:hypothetical protein
VSNEEDLGLKYDKIKTGTKALGKKTYRETSAEYKADSD